MVYTIISYPQKKTGLNPVCSFPPFEEGEPVDYETIKFDDSCFL